MVLLFLTFCWICLSLYKKFINSKNNYVQKNTIGYWLLICISIYISKYNIKNIYLFPIIYFVMVLIHDIFYYCVIPLTGIPINITKDEGEITHNFYKWFNIYTSSITKHNQNNTDISEGLFNNKWNLTNKQSLKLKYDTYFKYLKLEPGMKLLDIGCGNCHWLSYCKSKGIDCYGITLSESQSRFCKSKEIKAIVGDIQKDVLLTIKDKFDAISAIGPVEHFSSISQHHKERLNKLNKYYDQVKNLINPKSKSRRYLNSIMLTNEKYSKYQDAFWYTQIYFIATAFGYGYYPYEYDMDKIYKSKKSKLVIKRDYTEDYRWMTVRNNNTWGYANYKFNKFSYIVNFLKDVISDPQWWNRYFYGKLNSWHWQFGGCIKKPMPENIDTPIRSYIYVTEITN